MGFNIAGGTMLTFGGPLVWPPGGELVEVNPALAGHAKRPSLVGMLLGAYSAN